MKYTFIPHIPLIGGFPLGAEKALGHGPEFIASLTGFYGNDVHYVNYQNETLKRGLEYKAYDPSDNTFERKINIVVGTPPCAALSSMNTGTSTASRGAACAKNDFMYIVAEQSFKKFDSDVTIIENAPALFTTKGEPVAERLRRIAEDNNRSLTLYKTSTHFHGIPQRRDRTFAIFWNSPTAPLINWFNEDALGFEEYLDLVPDNAVQQDFVINPDLTECFSFNFLMTIMDSKKFRDEMNAAKIRTAFHYINVNGHIPAMLEFYKQKENMKAVANIQHAMDKFADGKGIWDASINTYSGTMNAVVGRALFNTMHPTKDRSLTVREAMHMMGFPHDFELQGGKKNINHIAQNVPVCTAASIVGEAIKFLDGKLEMSGNRYIRQNNWKKETTGFKFEQLSTNSLEAFF